MKRMNRIIPLLLAIIFVISITYAPCYGTETVAQTHIHGSLYYFDDTDMRIYNVFEGNLIEHLIMDVESFSGDGIRVYADEEEVFTGELQEGMTVEIYHSSELYGIYEIAELKHPDTTNSNIARTASNSYGFIMPIDNMSLGSNLTCRFGSDYGGPDTSYHDHRGIDIANGGNIGEINGKPIRAVKDGTVIWTQTWDGVSIDSNQSWGHCIKLSHEGNVTTLYAHMNAAPTLTYGQSVSQGQIIGYVGETGNAFGHHLHFEVAYNGNLVNPETYLADASTYVEATRIPATLSGDVNGDGYEDIIEMREDNGYRQLVTLLGSSTSTVSSTPITTSTTNLFVEYDPIYVGDVNGDGRSDVIVHFETDGKRAFVIYTGKSNGGFNSANRVVTTNAHDPDIYPCKLLAADFTGDGKTDFLVQYRATDGTRSNLVYKGNSSGTFDAAIRTTSTRTYIDTDPVFAADVNGDGCCDVIVHWASNSKRQLLTYLCSSSGTFSTPVNTATENTHSSAYESKFFIGEFDGDDYDDFLVHWSSGNGGYRYLLLYSGTSTGFFEIGVHTSTGSVNVSADPIMIGDVNGDGADDVIVEYVSGGNRAFLVYGGTSSGSFEYKVITNTSNIRDESRYPSRLFMADVTGDGLSDAVVIWCNSLGDENVIVYRGKGTKEFGSDIKITIGQKYYF